eukprot:TRINITY_DN8397_c0_g1_i1.p1 TRINITY_DN8397_c0_g1~~TRINITY_DN8397_c0_g1_i1.p1  ORF type:complete len:654 (+),score=69.30 TRINITY_DN8397_c0_g1_i1:131-2092(+)
MSKRTREQPGASWVWVDKQTGNRFHFAEDETNEIEKAFREKRSVQVGPWMIMNLKGERNGVVHQLVRLAKQTEYHLIDPDTVESYTDWANVKYSTETNLEPYLPLFFFSLRNSEDKAKAWCPFPGSDRDAFTEKQYQNFLTSGVDNQEDFDSLRIINFAKARQITPSWSYSDNNNRLRYYTDDQSMKIERTLCLGLDSLEINIQGTNNKFTIHPKELKQYPSGMPQRARAITRNPDRFRKLLRVKIGWFWQEDEEKNIWKPYSPENTRLIEDAYTTNQSCVRITVVAPKGERPYKINLVKMQQSRPNEMGLEHVLVRNIKRVGPRFDRAYIELPNITIKSSDLPSYWTFDDVVLFDNEGESDTTYSLVPRESAEWTKISDFMNRSVILNHETKYGYIPGTKTPPSRFKVLDIKRIQSKRLWVEYQKCKKCIIEKNAKLDPRLETILQTKPIKLGEEAILDPDANEFYLFHGTRSANIHYITDSGFNNRHLLEQLEKNPYKGMFGPGMYFAENSSKSNQYVDCPICHKGSIDSSKKKEGEIEESGMKESGMKERGGRALCNCNSKEVEKVGGYCMVLSRVIMGDPHLCDLYSKQQYQSLLSPPFEKDSVWAEAPIKTVDKKRGEELEEGLKYREFIVYDPDQCYPEYLIYYLRE